MSRRFFAFMETAEYDYISFSYILVFIRSKSVRQKYNDISNRDKNSNN